MRQLKKPPANTIRAWRLYRGFPRQKDLADRLGIARATVTRLESGDMPYRQKTLERIAKVLDCEPADLISREPYEKDLSKIHNPINPSSGVGMAETPPAFKHDDLVIPSTVSNSPIFGALKDTFTIEPGYDLAQSPFTQEELDYMEKRMEEKAALIEAGMRKPK